MYKAINIQNGQDIIIVDPQWTTATDQLRALCQRNLVVCQGCNQPVNARTGAIRRWHFAHKHLFQCTYGHDSPTLLQARAILYEWLVTKFTKSGAKTTLEKRLEGDALPRPIDCWVETESGAIAYWIFDSSMKPQARDALKQVLETLNVQLHWVFTYNRLRASEESADKIVLSTTERDFLQTTRYDYEIDTRYAPGGSLHYLDSETETLSTFRNLKCVHPPHIFLGRREHHALSAVLVSSKGAFVHPGEHERFQQYQEEQRRYQEEQRQLAQQKRQQAEQEQLARRRRIQAEEQRLAQQRLEEHKLAQQKWLQAEQIRLAQPDRKTKEDQVHDAGIAISNTERYPSTRTHFREKEGTCELCGQITSDWYEYDNKTRLCRCYDCLRQGRR